MWVVDGLLAGLIAGVFMGAISEAGYRFGLIKSHLVIIDGEYGLSMLKREKTETGVYAVGIPIHLITSIVFGVIYTTIAHLVGFNYGHAAYLPLYIVVLWVAMLFTALPVAGQGIAGLRIRKYVWVEQAVLHIVYGLGFWWALGIV